MGTLERGIIYFRAPENHLGNTEQFSKWSYCGDVWEAEFASLWVFYLDTSLAILIYQYVATCPFHGCISGVWDRKSSCGTHFWNNHCPKSFLCVEYVLQTIL
jgi:hypothetical protein